MKRFRTARAAPCRDAAGREAPGRVTGGDQAIAIYADADACPVKPEIYRVAERHGAQVFVVANSVIMVPREPFIERVTVASGPDAADDWIAARATPRDVVVTADIPLADRCVKAGAAVLAPNGKAFTAGSIGMALATRTLMDQLRGSGEVTGGPRPFSPRDRSAFLGALDRAVASNAASRRGGDGALQCRRSLLSWRPWPSNCPQTCPAT